MPTNERPKWADSFRFWLTDGQYDHLDKVGAADWRWTWRGWFESACLWLLCLTFGHKAVRDQCDKPEHDFCVYCCNQAMPGQAIRG